MVVFLPEVVEGDFSGLPPSENIPRVSLGIPSFINWPHNRSGRQQEKTGNKPVIPDYGMVKVRRWTGWSRVLILPCCHGYGQSGWTLLVQVELSYCTFDDLLTFTAGVNICFHYYNSSIGLTIIDPWLVSEVGRYSSIQGPTLDLSHDLSRESNPKPPVPGLTV